MKLQILVSVLPLLGLQAGTHGVSIPRRQADDAPQFNHGDVVPNRYIVQLAQGKDINEHFAEIGVDLSKEVAEDFSYIEPFDTYLATIESQELIEVTIPSAPDVVAVIASVILIPDKEPDLEGGSPPSTSASPLAAPATATGNNSSSNSSNSSNSQNRKRQGGIDKVAVDGRYSHVQMTAAEKVEGLSTNEMYSRTILNDAGRGVEIYVMDSGIRTTHRAFSDPSGGPSRARHFGGLSDTDDSPYCDAGEPMFRGDRNMGHGTFTSSIAGGAEPYGVAVAANVVNVKVICWQQGVDQAGNLVDSSYLKLDSVILAWSHILAEHQENVQSRKPGFKGSVISMSIRDAVPTSPELRDSLARYAQRLFDNGIPVVASAGNSAIEVNDLFCVVASVICVGASDANYRAWEGVDANGFSYGSNFGPAVDIWAPGVDVEGAVYDNDEFSTLTSGTSLSSPAVAGIIATFLGYEGEQLMGRDAGELRKRLMDNAIPDILDNMKPDTVNLFATTGIGLAEKAGINKPYIGAP